MISRILMTAAAVVMSGTLSFAAPLSGEETYNVLFKNGTLDDVSREQALIYDRKVENTLKPEAAERDTGKVALSVTGSENPVAFLEFRQDGKHRGMGKFPASVGNPMIMVFYETVIRDMAESAGGSAFYIRNRVKEALVEPTDMEEGEAQFDGRAVPVHVVTMQPFEGDPNTDRMQGFGDLTLTVTMSEEVPGWYMSLVAEAKGEDGATIYRSEMAFDGLEPVK